MRLPVSVCSIVSQLSLSVVGLYNLRGSDVEYNPVFFSYAIVTLTDAR